MSIPYDITTKQLVENRPGDWLALVGLYAPDAEIIDADLSSLTAEADKVIRVPGNHPWIAHLEFQTSYDGLFGQRMLRYNALLHHRHCVPVASIVYLLRREADGPAMSGNYRYSVPDTRTNTEFNFHVVRIWEKSVEELLHGGIWALPLAPISCVIKEDLPSIIEQMKSRASSELSSEQEGIFWTATYIMLGLKYPNNFSDKLLEGIRAMEDSVTYQSILAKGEARGELRGELRGEIRGEKKGELIAAREILLELGNLRFGAPDIKTKRAVEHIQSMERLKQMAKQILNAGSWEDLFV